MKVRTWAIEDEMRRVNSLKDGTGPVAWCKGGLCYVIWAVIWVMCLHGGGCQFQVPASHSAKNMDAEVAMPRGGLAQISTEEGKRAEEGRELSKDCSRLENGCSLLPGGVLEDELHHQSWYRLRQARWPLYPAPVGQWLLAVPRGSGMARIWPKIVLGRRE